MADVIFNIAKGRWGQWIQNVEDNSPVAAVLRLFAIVSTDTDDAIRDTDSITALIALGNTAEATNTNYANLVLDETDITITVDDTNNRLDIDLTDQVWSNIVAGDNWTHVILAYDDDGTDTDTNTIPIASYDFVVTPNGGDITAEIDVAGALRAS
jgi:hypothetical protein